MSLGDYFDSPSALTIVEEEEVSLALDEACKKYSHANDMFEAAKWRIARQPECGTIIEDEEPYRRLLKLPPIKKSENPTLLIRYYVGKHEVTIDWIRFSPYDKQQAVSPPAFILRK